MEQKKRKKARKKNRSGHLEDVQEAAAPLPSFETPDVTLLDREGDAIPAAEAAAGEGIAPNGPSSENVQEAAAPLPSFEMSDVTLLDREGDAIAAAEAAAGEGIAPNEPSSELQESTLRLSDPALPPAELQQIARIVQELRNAYDSEARNSLALGVFLNDIKAAHATSQANLDCLIEQLRGELVYLKQGVNSQKSKEVNLDADIQGLREEVSQLKVMQQAERERKEAESVEIQQLRKEMAKLSADSLKQLRMVEAMSDILQQLPKPGQVRTPMESSQLAHNPAVHTPFASEAGVALHSESLKEQSESQQSSLPLFTQSDKPKAVAFDTSRVSCGTQGSELYGALVLPQVTEVDKRGVEDLQKVNGYHALINSSIQHESNMNRQSEQTKRLEVENQDYSTSSGNPLVTHFGACAREVPVTYVEAERTKKDEVLDCRLFANDTEFVKKEQANDSSLFVDSNEFVSVFQERQEEKNLHDEFTAKTINSDMAALRAQMQVTELKPLSDAPITGAPIRLFRFVARYVSGADLVQ